MTADFDPDTHMRTTTGKMIPIADPKDTRRDVQKLVSKAVSRAIRRARR